jgi:hypothetical protein
MMSMVGKGLRPDDPDPAWASRTSEPRRFAHLANLTRVAVADVIRATRPATRNETTRAGKIADRPLQLGALDELMATLALLR